MLEHDPRLAKRVHRALLEAGGRPRYYHIWLRDYVKPLAEANGVELYMPNSPVKHYRAVSVKVPLWLYEKLVEIARELDTTVSEVLRLAAWLLAELHEKRKSRDEA